MAIGTSLGAYFEDEFHHQAGIDTPPEVMKPNKDTGDDNALPPDPDSQGREGDPKVLQVSDTTSTMPPGAHREPAGAFDLSRAPYGTSSPGELPEGSLQGQVLQRQLGDTFNPAAWIQKAGKAIHDVASGSVPMWAMNPDTGEFHTSPEGIESATGLAPLAVSGAGFPLKVELQPEAHQALSEGLDVFQQFMATRGARQPSNIVDHPVEPPYQPHYPIGTTSPVSRYPEQDARMGITPGDPRFEQTPFDGGSHILQGRHPDALNDEEFYNWGQYQGENQMTRPQEDRWVALDVAHAEREHGSEPIDWHDRLNADIEENERAGGRFGKARMQEVKDQFTENPDAVKSKGNVSLMLDPDHEMNNSGHHYNFLSADGIPGELTVRMRDAGKDIHVSWIGTVGSHGPRDVGNSEMKNLFKLLAEQYPDAERVSGFRVSGARAEQGRIGDASMRIPGRTQSTPRPWDNSTGPLGAVNAHRY